MFGVYLFACIPETSGDYCASLHEHDKHLDKHSPVSRHRAPSNTPVFWGVAKIKPRSDISSTIKSHEPEAKCGISATLGARAKTVARNPPSRHANANAKLNAGWAYSTRSICGYYASGALLMCLSFIGSRRAPI